MFLLLIFLIILSSRSWFATRGCCERSELRNKSKLPFSRVLNHFTNVCLVPLYVVRPSAYPRNDRCFCYRAWVLIFNTSCNSDGLECSSIKTLEACPAQRGKLLSGPERWLCDDCFVFWWCVFVPNWFAAKLLMAYPSAQYKEC